MTLQGPGAAGAAPAWTRRLKATYAAEWWIGFVARVVPAARHDSADAVVLTPDHFLGAAWPPPAERLARWPDVVVIGSPTADSAITLLFGHVPADAFLYLADGSEVDATLAARILRDADRNLEDYQRQGLDAFIAALEERERRVMSERYTDRDEGYEAFRAIVLR